MKTIPLATLIALLPGCANTKIVVPEGADVGTLNITVNQPIWKANSVSGSNSDATVDALTSPSTDVKATGL